MVNSLTVACFGRQVAELSFHDARVGNVALRDRLSETEVRYFNLTGARYQDIGRRQISMDNSQMITIRVALFMRVSEAFTDLRHDVTRYL